MRRVVLVALAAALLGLPAPAAAKELTRLVVCGPSDCVTIGDRTVLRTLVLDAVPTGREPSGAYYVLDGSFATEEGTDTWRLEYDVAANMIRPVDEPGGIGWARLTKPQSPQFLAAIDDLAPFTTKKLAATQRVTGKRTDGGFSWLTAVPAALGIAAIATSGFALARRRRRL